MVSLAVIVLEMLVDHTSQMLFSEKDHSISWRYRSAGSFPLLGAMEAPHHHGRTRSGLPRDCDFARQGIAPLRLRATLTGESDLRLLSAVGVRRVSMLGTVLEGMLTKSA
jgi:hypothetical protein